ncbi:MAG: glycerate kinase [Planctomycetota bacterium]|jgi:glycerate kinase
MKIVIAPDSFKESLSAIEVAGAIAEGALAACGEASVDLCPMADGGEGTVEAMVAATGGEFFTADVFGPLGSKIRARYGLLGHTGGATLPGEVGLVGAQLQAEGEGGQGGRKAVIEMASASGLALVPMDKRDPTVTTTFGTGELILAALDHGAGEIIIGIGGSATTDGGCGCAQALGVSFIDRQGEMCVCGLAGGGLADIGRIDLTTRDPRVAETRIHVACDVTNPLTGPNGAAFVYGPQKGATPEQVQRLDDGLRHMASVVRESLGIDVEHIPGAGAAGGLGAGLVAYAGATLERGVEMISEAVDLRARLSGADLCITGEGKFDSQSASGKTAFGVAQLAAEAGVPVICLAGSADAEAPHGHFVSVRALVEGDVTVRQAMQQAAPLLEQRATTAVAEFLSRD